MAAGMVGNEILIMQPLVTLHNLTLSYRRQPAVHHINGAFMAGALTAIAGPNGGGKSTLLKAIAGMLPIHEGSIGFHGITRKDIAYLPQLAEVDREFPLSILQMVASGFWHGSGAFGRITQTQIAQARLALESVGLHGFEQRSLNSLSPGQFQRTLFARLLVQDAKLLLLDEPFSAIDTATTETLLRIINRWRQEGRTVICVLHDFSMIRSHFSQCLLLARECIAWGAPQEILKPEALFHAHMFQPLNPKEATQS